MIIHFAEVIASSNSNFDERLLLVFDHVRSIVDLREEVELTHAVYSVRSRWILSKVKLDDFVFPHLVLALDPNPRFASHSTIFFVDSADSVSRRHVDVCIQVISGECLHIIPETLLPRNTIFSI